MSNTYAAVPPSGSGNGSASGTGSTGSTGKGDAAKEQAADLGHKTAAAGQHVAGVAKDEAGKVASEAKTQAKDLLHEARGQLRDQASSQQERVASGLHSLSDELSDMAQKSDNPGLATDLAHQVASRADSAAAWLDNRDPGSLLDEVRHFARQRPGTFIAMAAVAGVLAGRLTRSITAEAKDEHSSSGSVGDAGAYDSRINTPSAARLTEPPMTTPAFAPATTSGYDPDADLIDVTAPVPPSSATTTGDDYYLGNPRP